MTVNPGLSLSILQWNIQGFLSNKYALEILVCKHKPNIIMLQETHIIDRNLHLLHLPGYKIYHHNKNYSYAKSGIAIMIKNGINVVEHSTSSGNLLHQTVTIQCSTRISFTNIYKEYDITLSDSMVNSIRLPPRSEQILVGDLNSQNTLWGSNTRSTCGIIWEDFANDKNLVVLNDGSPTLLNTRHTLTAVDVSMASSGLAPSLNWSCLPLPETSDHFPIIMTNNIQVTERLFLTRFKEKYAD